MLPNFIYIGPDKAGSTWIYEVLSWHPDVFMASAKDICFFDLHYDKGVGWYKRHFSNATSESVLGEVSHNYLFSRKAAQRMRYTLPDDVTLMICLREPSARAFSAYLYLRKHGLYTGDFECAIRDVPELIDHGRYATHLKPYAELFSQDNLYVAKFSDLKADSAQFAQDLFEELGLKPLSLPSSLQEKKLPASRSRSVVLSRLLKQLAIWARQLGFVRLIGAVKHSPLVKKLLYKPYSPGEKPRPQPETMRQLREIFFEEVSELDQMLGTNFNHEWEYGAEYTKNSHTNT